MYARWRHGLYSQLSLSRIQDQFHCSVSFSPSLSLSHPSHPSCGNIYRIVSRQRCSHSILSLSLSRQDEDGRTLLHWASVIGRHEVLDLLFERRAQVNTQDEGGFSPLISAASAGRLDVVNKLIEHEADINMQVCVYVSLSH